MAPSACHRMEQHHRRVDEMATPEGNIRTMEDRELAKQIEAMRDDAHAWGEPSQEPKRKRKSERRQRGALVSVRFSPDELASVQAHASTAGNSVSGYLRSLALTAAQQPIVTMTWNGATTTNATSTKEDFVVRGDQIPAWLHPRQALTTPPRERPSNQVSKNHHGSGGRQRTPTDSAAPGRAPSPQA